LSSAFTTTLVLAALDFVPQIQQNAAIGVMDCGSLPHRPATALRAARVVNDGTVLAASRRPPPGN
jgi:hypothetical protein